MLIEFTGPSACGKTEFIRHLLSKWEDAKPVRYSVSKEYKIKIDRTACALTSIHYFPISYIFANAWKRNALPQFSPLRAASEYCLLKGLSHSSCTWILDQGRLQFGSWLPTQTCQDPIKHLNGIEKFIIFGDAIVLNKVHPKYAIAKMKERDGVYRTEKIAKNRGFISADEYYSDYYYNQSQKKIEYLNKITKPLLVNNINIDGTLEQYTYNSNDITKEIALIFNQWWNPNHLINKHN